MKSEHDPDRTIRSWLEVGVTDLPDRVLDSVLGQLPATPQRRLPWRARRISLMTSAPKLAMSAAAVVVAGLIGVNLLSGTAPPDVGAPPPATATPSPSSTPDPSPMAASQPVPYGAMTAGRYHIDIQLASSIDAAVGDRLGRPARVTFDVPDGWSGGGWLITKAVDSPSEVAMAPFVIDRVYLDPCHTAGAEGRGDATDPALARSMDGLVDAFTLGWSPETGLGFAPTSPLASRPSTTMLAGSDARYLTVRHPAALDIASCDGGLYHLWVDPQGEKRYSSGGEFNRLWIVDIDPATRGAPLVIDAASFPDATPEDIAELEAIVDSIQIELLAD